MAIEPNLLFGVLTVQLKLVTPQKFVDAAAVWVANQGVWAGNQQRIVFLEVPQMDGNVPSNSSDELLSEIKGLHEVTNKLYKRLGSIEVNVRWAAFAVVVTFIFIGFVSCMELAEIHAGRSSDVSVESEDWP